MVGVVVSLVGRKERVGICDPSISYLSLVLISVGLDSIRGGEKDETERGKKGFRKTK